MLEIKKEVFKNGQTAFYLEEVITILNQYIIKTAALDKDFQPRIKSHNNTQEKIP